MLKSTPREVYLTLGGIIILYSKCTLKKKIPVYTICRKTTHNPRFFSTSLIYFNSILWLSNTKQCITEGLKLYMVIDVAFCLQLKMLRVCIQPLINHEYFHKTDQSASIHAPVFSRMDYYDSVFTGLPKQVNRTDAVDPECYYSRPHKENTEYYPSFKVLVPCSSNYRL